MQMKNPTKPIRLFKPTKVLEKLDKPTKVLEKLDKLDKRSFFHPKRIILRYRNSLTLFFLCFLLVPLSVAAALAAANYLMLFGGFHHDSFIDKFTGGTLIRVERLPTLAEKLSTCSFQIMNEDDIGARIQGQYENLPKHPGPEEMGDRSGSKYNKNTFWIPIYEVRVAVETDYLTRHGNGNGTGTGGGNEKTEDGDETVHKMGSRGVPGQSNVKRACLEDSFKQNISCLANSIKVMTIKVDMTNHLFGGILFRVCKEYMGTYSQNTKMDLKSYLFSRSSNAWTKNCSTYIANKDEKEEASDIDSKEHLNLVAGCLETIVRGELALTVLDLKIPEILLLTTDNRKDSVEREIEKSKRCIRKDLQHINELLEKGKHVQCLEKDPKAYACIDSSSLSYLFDAELHCITSDYKYRSSRAESKHPVFWNITVERLL